MKKYIWLGGNVTHAVVKITNYTTNYDGVDIRRGVERRFALKFLCIIHENQLRKDEIHLMHTKKN